MRARSAAPKLRMVAAAVAVALAPLGVSPIALAETRLVVPGTEYRLGDSLPPIPLIRRYYTPSADIGEGFYPDSTPAVVDYPASVFDRGSIARHVAVGAANLGAAIRTAPGTTIVASHSQGSVVVDEVQRRLQSDPAAPAADRLRFIIFADPMRGVVKTLFKEGVRIPVVGLSATSPAESRYDTVVVTNEYDFWGDFPDRPWNPVALANAIAGGVFVHSRAAFAPEGIPAANVTTSVNSQGATVTTYLVPAQRLPLTEPLRIAGVPAALVDAVDRKLRPVVDAGYSRNDPTGRARPYLYHGTIRARPGASGRVLDRPGDGSPHPQRPRLGE